MVVSRKGIARVGNVLSVHINWNAENLSEEDVMKRSHMSVAQENVGEKDARIVDVIS